MSLEIKEKVKFTPKIERFKRRYERYVYNIAHYGQTQEPDWKEPEQVSFT